MILLGAGDDSYSEVRSPTSTSTEVRSPTSTSTEVRSPTSTSTEVRSPTSTSTDAYTQGNITVTGGAGAGATTSVNVFTLPPALAARADEFAHRVRSAGAAQRMTDMIQATGAPRVPGVMPDLMQSTGASRPMSPIPGVMQSMHSRSWIAGFALGGLAMVAGLGVLRASR